MAEVEKIYREFGQRLAKRRKTLEMSQDDLARTVGMKRASITNLEAGKQRVTLHQAMALSNAVRVRIEELLPSQDVPVAVGRDFDRLRELNVPIDDEVFRWVLRATERVEVTRREKE